MGGSRGQVSIATRSGGGLEYSLRRGKDSHPGYAEACRFTTFSSRATWRLSLRQVACTESDGSSNQGK